MDTDTHLWVIADCEIGAMLEYKHGLSSRRYRSYEGAEAARKFYYEEGVIPASYSVYELETTIKRIER